MESKSSLTSQLRIKLKQQLKCCNNSITLHLEYTNLEICECNASHLEVILNPLNAIKKNYFLPCLCLCLPLSMVFCLLPLLSYLLCICLFSLCAKGFGSWYAFHFCSCLVFRVCLLLFCVYLFVFILF